MRLGPLAKRTFLVKPLCERGESVRFPVPGVPDSR